MEALYKQALSITQEPKNFGTLCQVCLSTPIPMTSDKTGPDWLATKETPDQPGRPSRARILIGSRRSRAFHCPIHTITGCCFPPPPLGPGFPEALPKLSGMKHSQFPGSPLADGFSPLVPIPPPPPQVRPGSSSRKFGLPAGLQGSSLQSHLG